MLSDGVIRLRAVEREDLPRFVQWLNDPEVRSNLELVSPLSMAQEEGWFEQILKRPAAEQPLVIEANEDETWRALGNCSLFNIDQHDRSAELGIFIGDKQYWNHGIGTRAVRLLLRHAFLDLNLNRVFLRVYESNPRGARCYEKAGMKLEGRMRQARYRQGKYIDVLLMAALKDEWLAENMTDGGEL